MEIIRSTARPPPTTGPPAAAAVSWSGRAWWAALAVLVVNDHLLKGLGLLPGWLTGKLSDFTGLIVAPVLAAVIVRARGARRRALAFAPVLLIFGAIKVSPAAGGALEVAMSWVGLRWRLWCDPTDLLALAVVPFSWRIAAGWAAQPRLPAKPRRLLPVIVGAAACLATSTVTIGYRTPAFITNMTIDTLEVRVYRAQEPLDCARLADEPGDALLATFRPALCTWLRPGQPLPLARRWSLLSGATEADLARAVENPPCEAVIVRVADLPDTLLVWHGLEDVDVHDWTLPGQDSQLDAHGIYLERLEERLYAAGTPLVTAGPSNVALPAPACADFPEKVKSLR